MLKRARSPVTVTEWVAALPDTDTTDNDNANDDDDIIDNDTDNDMVLGAEAEDGKAMLICGVTDDLTDRFHAGQIIKELSAKVGGKGGGRPDMAQGGGPNGNALAETLALAAELFQKQDPNS